MKRAAQRTIIRDAASCPGKIKISQTAEKDMRRRAVHTAMVTRTTSFEGLARNTDETIRPKIEVVAKLTATFPGMNEI